MSSIKVNIITPEKLALSADVDFVVAPASDGEIGILPGHTPLLTRLGIGELRLTKGNKHEYFAIAGGFLEVQSGSLVEVFAETAEMAQDIDVERAQQQLERAKKEIKNYTETTDMNLREAEMALARSMLRIKVAQTRAQKKVQGQSFLHQE